MTHRIKNIFLKVGTHTRTSIQPGEDHIRGVAYCNSLRPPSKAVWPRDYDDFPTNTRLPRGATHYSRLKSSALLPLGDRFR